MPFNTAQIPDGPQQISVLVSDPAGNTTMILGRSVMVENTGQYLIKVQREQQEQTLAVRGACNAECDDHAILHAAKVKLTTRAFTRLYVHSGLTLRGQLLDHAGSPMKGAVIELLQQAGYPGAQNVLVATAITDVEGDWTFRVPDGPSRVLTVGYRSYGNDPGFAMQLQYRETVKAGVRLAAPRRARPGKSFNFRGHLAGGYIPSGGALISLEIDYGGKWREIALLRTKSRGEFAYRYTFAPIGSATYGFRAQVPDTTGYPFAASVSPPIYISSSMSWTYHYIRLIALSAGLAMMPTPVVAYGEVPYTPSQAIADYGTWLPFAPAPAQPAGICLIDSGVDMNPSTQPEVIYRGALDGGNPDDVSPVEHGTLMAMEAAAPDNGWGMIGAAPTAVRIASIRAESATDALTFGAYKQAIVACQDLAERNPELNLKVISMSIGFQGQPSPEQLAELENAATTAHDAGLDIVAAAGDEGSQSISYPAAMPPILAIGASGANRTQCSFSNTGPQLALLAPGCDLQEVNPVSGAPTSEYAGTSQATAITAAVLAALRAYQPNLGAAEAERSLISTARSAGGSLDVTALFRAAGLDDVIEAGERNEPKLSATAPTQPPSNVPPQPSGRLPRPRVSVRHQGNTVLVRFLNLPSDGKAILCVFSRQHDHRSIQFARVATRHPTVRLQAHANTTVSIIYTAIQPSPARTSPTKVIEL